MFGALAVHVIHCTSTNELLLSHSLATCSSKAMWARMWELADWQHVSGVSCRRTSSAEAEQHVRQAAKPRPHCLIVLCQRCSISLRPCASAESEQHVHAGCKA